MSVADPPRRVALLAPMPAELQPLVRMLSLRRQGEGHGAVHAGRAGRIDVVATTTGIGTVRAARAAHQLLDAAPVDHLVVVGIAGGIGPSVAIGDVVVPERVLDLATGEAYVPSPMGGTPPRGVLATSDVLVSDPGAAARLEGRGVVAIDMETAAIAAVCEKRGCPWSVFRAISDRADDGSTDAAILALAGPDGRPRPGAVARFLLTRPWRIPQLLRLARGLRRSTDAAAASAVRALGAAQASPSETDGMSPSTPIGR